MRPPSPPDTNASPSGLNATVRTGAMCPLSWNTHFTSTAFLYPSCKQVHTYGTLDYFQDME